MLTHIVWKCTAVITQNIKKIYKLNLEFLEFKKNLVFSIT